MNLTNVQHVARGTSKPNSVLIAVGGGKGGVGKSFISSNLGIFLANMGFNTVIIDLDLGAPNLHTCLGEPPPKLNYHNYLSGNIETLAEVAVTTQFPKLRLISGANDHKELANINQMEKTRLMSAIFRLDADFTIMDLSAGTHTSTLDFFLMANRHLVTLTPDPTSIENAYRFMKATYYRHIKRYEKQCGLQNVIENLMANSVQNNIKVPSDLINRVLAAEPERGQLLRDTVMRLKFELIMNQTRGRSDIDLCHSIQAISKKYFGIPVSALGHIEYDNCVWNALRKRKPLLLEYPHSSVYSQLLSVARDLASPHLKKAVI